MTHPSQPFIHEALLYGDLDEFLAGTVRLLQEGFEQDAPALVAIPEPRLSALREALGADAARRSTPPAAAGCGS